MIAIRSATPDDLASVVDLWNRAAGPTRRAGQIPEASALLARDADALIVAEDAGEIVGTLIVGWDGWRCHLYRLAVDPSVRRSGIASRLVAEARARAAALGVFRIDAMVDGDNAGAHGFWASIGFDVDGHGQRWSVLL